MELTTRSKVLQKLVGDEGANNHINSKVDL
jgi:hypothetical protein